MAQSGGAPPPFVPRPSSAPASSLSSRPRLGTPPLPRAGFATVPRQSGRFWTPPARSPRPTEVPSSPVGLDSHLPSPCGVAASDVRGTETAPTTKKLLQVRQKRLSHVACFPLRRRTPRRGRHDPRDERREVGASGDAHPGPTIPVLGSDRARRTHGVERLPAELRVVIVVAPVVRIDARRVDARGVVR
jgi:hypothetical protein